MALTDTQAKRYKELTAKYNAGKASAKEIAERKTLHSQLKTKTTTDNTTSTDGDTADTTPGSATADNKAATAERVRDALTSGSDYADSILGKGDDWYGRAEATTIDATRAKETQDYLDRLNQIAQTAGNYTDTETEALANLRAGLSGYSAPEIQAMREQAATELNNQVRKAQYASAMSNARAGIRGAAAGAANADLNIGRIQAQGNLERDLMVKNAEEAQRRRESFANIVNQTETARFGRQKDSNSLYGGALGEAQSREQAANIYNANAKSAADLYNANAQTNAKLSRGSLVSAGAGMYSGQLGAVEAAEQARLLQEQAKDDRDTYWKQTNALMDKYLSAVKQTSGV